MTKTTETPPLTSSFKKYYESMPANFQRGFIDLIIQGCDVSERTVYKWFNHPEIIKKPFREKIAELAHKTVEELFTDKTEEQ